MILNRRREYNRIEFIIPGGVGDDVMRSLVGGKATA